MRCIKLFDNEKYQPVSMVRFTKERKAYIRGFNYTGIVFS